MRHELHVKAPERMEAYTLRLEGQIISMGEAQQNSIAEIEDKLGRRDDLTYRFEAELDAMKNLHHVQLKKLEESWKGRN